MSAVPAGADLRPRRAYVLPDMLRRELAKPFGPVVAETELKAALAGVTVVVAVGDVVSLTCKRLGIKPKLFVCDFKTQRGDDDPAMKDELGMWGRVGFRVKNPAGKITREAWDAVRRALWVPESPVRIVVDGEEDLLGIPCFLEVPDGAAVLYGMPGQGIVVVKVDESFRQTVRGMLARFEVE
jgi:uncharacterized protein (UPF0218 family)